ncbi:peptide ABC transporter substrate-binding protein [Pikeienuella piscinae]|uniref:Peptide ABC transporter substrate-binding protein n=2 Tax=Pikeienuella piscinae TaxID=2748098 RepID=A0A7M3T780_9RHOB|nr:peptide ABC transporter substrate-binding protein [Pikeienuella piscinae]
MKLGAAAFLMSSAASRAFAANDAPSGQVIVGFSQEPTVFNPHMLHIEVDEGVHWNVFDPLFGVLPDGSFYPALASEVPSVENGGISEDGLKWRVKLREGVTWHDGEPFTAEDVKYTLELIVDPDFRSGRRTGHELVRNIEVVSDHEITWEMEAPFAPYPAILAWTFMVPKHILGEAADPNTADFNQAPVGTGAYKWVERIAGDHITLGANKEYWGEGPHLEQLVFKYIPDMTVMYTQFKTGDIDVIALQGITPDHYEEAKGLDGKTVVIAPSAAMESISLNMERPQFQDHAVRQALYHALDKATIIEALYYGIPNPTESYMPQQSLYYNPDLPKHEYSIEKANKLLDDAGWVRGSDGIREKDGLRLAFTNSTTAGNHTREQMQQFVQQSFAEIGAEMTIKNLPPAVMWGEYWMMSQWDSVVVGITFVTGPDPDTSDYFSSTAINAQGGAGQNTWQINFPEVDELLQEGGRIFVPEERKKVYFEIQEIMREKLPFLPIFQYANLRGHKDGLEGYTPNVNLRITTWNVNTWKWA